MVIIFEGGGEELMIIGLYLLMYSLFFFILGKEIFLN